MSKNSIRTVDQKIFNNLFWRFPVQCKLVSLGFFFWPLKMLLMTHWSYMSRSLIPLENSFGRSTEKLKNCSSPFFIFLKMKAGISWLKDGISLQISACDFDCIWIYLYVKRNDYIFVWVFVFISKSKLISFVYECMYASWCVCMYEYNFFPYALVNQNNCN